MRSDMIKVGVDKAPARGLLYATGQVKSSKDMQKPFIAICNSYIDIVPGHVHPRELADIAKEAIREAGGIPFEFNTIGVDDGIAMGPYWDALQPPFTRINCRCCRNRY